jgi:hypothetical protein
VVVPSSLRRTWALVIVALLAILPVAFLSFRDAVRAVFPTCQGSIEETIDSYGASDGVPVLHDDAQPGGFSLHLDASGSHGASRMRISRIERDGNGNCDCGALYVLVPVSSSYYSLDVRRVSRGHYVVADSKRVLTTFKTTDEPTHRFQPERIVRRQHLPAIVVLAALFALGIAGLRARKGIGYATKMHTWTEASLDAGGRIESETGETLGVLDSTGRRIFPGALIIEPTAYENKGGLYRDVPIIARRFVAMGTHARWQEWTMRGFRDARALCVISTACSALALAARFLGAL